MWKRRIKEVNYDEIFLDAVNVSSFNQNRMEGRLELPITRRNVYVVGVIFILIALWFFSKLFTLQVLYGAEYRERSESNRIDEDVIIAERGVIYDRHGEMLAWNEEDYTDEYDFPVRAYNDRNGLGQLIGYVSYPLKDTKGIYYRTEYVGRNGIESSFNEHLAGENGRRLLEVNALGEVISEHAVESPAAGEELQLSLDAALSEAMYEIIASSSIRAGIRSGAGAIMDIETGELIAMTSYPSYDPEVMADGDDVELIAQYNNDGRFPFLNKAIAGTYTPGSIVKPFVAYAALSERVISEWTEIASYGEIVIPNPYNPSNPAVFRDWRSQGIMTVREAIAFSSNVFFYIIGGGFGDQPGIGITRMHRYFTDFGLGRATGIDLANELDGTVPNPAWKQEVFDDDWRLGDTYYTAIGQYGFLITPLQMLRAYAALANGGVLLKPQLLKGADPEVQQRLEIDEQALRVVHEGMRKTVNFDGGTARALERKDVAIAAKSGTAELDYSKSHVNSWAAGFFPYDEPKYAFILLMEHAPYGNSLGATRVMGDVVEWMSEYTPEYLGIEPPETPEE